MKDTECSSWVHQSSLKSSLTTQCSTGGFEKLNLAAVITIKKRIGNAVAALPPMELWKNTDTHGLITVVNIGIR